jgi:hypothetical protein
VGYGKRRNVFTLIDAATDFRWAKAQKQKTGEENLEVMQKFQGSDPKDEIKYV